MKKNLLMILIVMGFAYSGKSQVILRTNDVSRKVNRLAKPNEGSVTGTIYYQKGKEVNFFAGATQVELHEVIENKKPDANGFADSKIALGPKITGITFTKPDNAADSFRFSIEHIPLNKKFIIMLRYYSSAGDGGEGDGKQFEITTYSNRLAIRGAFFYCTGFESNLRSNIITCTEANKDVVNYWIMINDEPIISIH